MSLTTSRSAHANNSDVDVGKRKTIQRTYGEKSDILKIVLTAIAQGQSIRSAARTVGISEQTISGFLKNRKEIEEIVTSSKGGSTATRNRKINNLHTLNSLVLNELSGFASGSSTNFLIKVAKEAGARFRMKLLKEQVVTKNELARLEGFKASRPWAKNLVQRVEKCSIECRKVQYKDRIPVFGLSAGKNSSNSW
jgi:molybdenum-dependent DNA-binding transcriptional regulator ModE